MDEQTRLVEFFYNAAHGGNEYKTNYYEFPEGHDYEKYNLFTNNCTTFAVDALRYAYGESMPYGLEGHFVPLLLYADLKANMNSVLARRVVKNYSLVSVE